MSTMFIVIITVLMFVILAIGVWLFTSGGSKKSVSQPSLMKGLYLLTEGDNDSALEELKRVVMGGMGTPEVYIIMAVLYRKKGELLKAIHLNEGLLLRGDLSKTSTVIVLRELIKCYRASGTLSRAEEWVSKLQDEVHEPELLLIKANLLSYKGKHEEAIKKYVRYERATNKSCHKEISLEYMEIANKATETSQKLKALRNALKYDPDNRYAYFKLAEIYLNENKETQAMQELNTLIQRGLIRTKEDLHNVEEFFFEHGSLENLYRMMAAKAAAGNEDPAAYIFLSGYYNRKGDHEKAVKILKNYLTDIGTKAIILREYARLTGDSLLLKAARLDNIYKCSVCDTKYAEYVDVCLKCGSMETLKYI